MGEDSQQRVFAKGLKFKVLSMKAVCLHTVLQIIVQGPLRICQVVSEYGIILALTKVG